MSLSGPVELPFSSTLSTTTVRSLQAIFYILFILFGITLNTLVIVLVAKYKKLQTRSFAIALQVVVLNLARHVEGEVVRRFYSRTTAFPIPHVSNPVSRHADSQL